MRRRLIAAVAALVVIGSLLAVSVSSSSRPCCCKNASACSMHQKHAAQGCRLDRCSGERDAATAGIAAMRAVLVYVVLPLPAERDVVFDRSGTKSETRAVAPSVPPPRAA